MINSLDPKHGTNVDSIGPYCGETLTPLRVRKKIRHHSPSMQENQTPFPINARKSDTIPINERSHHLPEWDPRHPFRCI